MSLHRVFFYLLVLFLPTQLGKHFWPEWSMVLGRRVDYLSPTLYATDILIVLTVLCWFIEIVLQKRKIALWMLSGFYNTRYVLPFAVLGVINILIASSKPVAFYAWAKVAEYGLLAFYVVKTRPRASRVSLLLSLAALYSSAIAIVQFMLQRSIGGPLWWLGERTFDTSTPGIARIDLCLPRNELRNYGCQQVLRPYATFPHPNVLGGFLAAFVPLQIATLLKRCGPARFSLSLHSFQQRHSEAVHQLMRSIKEPTTLYTTGVIIVGLTALLLTFSRGAWIAGIVGIIMVVASHVYKKTRHVELLFFGAFFFMALVVFLFLGDSESVVVRQRLNTGALQQWMNSPVFGVGLGNFLVQLPKTLLSRTMYFLQPAHNIYLLVLAETGVTGLVAFFGVLWGAIRQNRKHPFSPFRAPLAVYLALGLIDHYPVTLQQGQLLLTILVALSTMAP